MTIIYDFNLPNTSPPPSRLLPLQCEFEVQANKLYAKTVVPSPAILTTTYGNQVGLELSNGTASVVVNGEGSLTGIGGVIFRLQDVDNFLAAVIDYSTGTLELRRWDTGIPSVLGQYIIPSFDNSIDYIITVQPNGDNIDVLLDSVLRINVTSAVNQIAITQGLVTDSLTISLDNLAVSEPVNSAPIADAGLDQIGVAGGSTVALDGSLSSDIDGDPITYNWEQITGNATVTLSSTLVAQPFFTAPSNLTSDILMFRLNVSDGELESFDTVTIAVDAAVQEVVDNVDILERQFINETNGDKLERLGSMAIISDSSAFGVTPVQVVSHNSTDYKTTERLGAGQDNVDDSNGLGYQYINTDQSGV